MGVRSVSSVMLVKRYSSAGCVSPCIDGTVHAFDDATAHLT